MIDQALTGLRGSLHQLGEVGLRVLALPAALHRHAWQSVAAAALERARSVALLRQQAAWLVDPIRIALPGMSSRAAGRGDVLRVADCMSPEVLAVKSTTTLFEVARLFVTRRVDCVMVTEDGRPLAPIGMTDVLRELVRDPQRALEMPAGEVVGAPIVGVGLDVPIDEALAALARHGTSYLPVVDPEARVAGAVTERDLLSVFRGHLGSCPGAAAVGLGDDQLAAAIHDIRSGLTTVDAVLQLLDPEPAEAAMMLPPLRLALSRMGNRMFTVLGLHQLERGRPPLHQTEVAWTTLAERALGEVALALDERQLTVDESGELDAMVRGDATLLLRVLVNLLEAAIQLAPEDSTIDLDAECVDPSTLVIRVGHRGPVLPTDRPAEQIPGLWTLGLRFCRLAAERHGGTVRVTAPYIAGTGSAFVLILPGAVA